MDTDLELREAFNLRRADCVNNDLTDPSERGECLTNADNDEY